MSPLLDGPFVGSDGQAVRVCGGRVFMDHSGSSEHRLRMEVNGSIQVSMVDGGSRLGQASPTGDAVLWEDGTSWRRPTAQEASSPDFATFQQAISSKISPPPVPAFSVHTTPTDASAVSEALPALTGRDPGSSSPAAQFCTSRELSVHIRVVAAAGKFKRGSKLRKERAFKTSTIAAGFSFPVSAPDMMGTRRGAAGLPASFKTIVSEFSLNEGREEPRAVETVRTNQKKKMSKAERFGIPILFLLLDCVRALVDAWALNDRDHEGIAVAVTMVWIQAAISMFIAVVLTGILQGCHGLWQVLGNFRELAVVFPAGLGFALSQAFLLMAYVHNMSPVDAEALGYLAMPLTAVLSRICLKRIYGPFDSLALCLLFIASITFVEVRNRLRNRHHGTLNSERVWFSFVSTTVYVFASLYIESYIKPHRGRFTGRYWVQKGRIEAAGLCTSLVVWIGYSLGVQSQHWIPHLDHRVVIALVVRVAQSWMAGLMAKRFSQMAKLVIQCITLIVLYFVGDLAVWGDTTNTVAALLQATMLAFVVSLSALLYPLGRRDTVLRQQLEAEESELTNTASASESATEPSGTSLPQIPSVGSMGQALDQAADAALLAEFKHTNFDVDVAPRSRTRPGARLSTMVRTSPAANLVRALYRNWSTYLLDKEWAMDMRDRRNRIWSLCNSRTGLAMQLGCVVLFIMFDAAKTIAFEKALKNSPIVTQSIVVAGSAGSVVVGTVMSATSNGRQGVKAALDPRAGLRCLGIAACFSVSQTFGSTAYALGIAASVNVVIGYFYMPLSAMLSRAIFHRAYSLLEWLALMLVTLSAIVFVLLKSAQVDSDGDSATNPLAFVSSFFCVVFACLGSVLCEKTLKASKWPFHVVKVNLETGGTIVAVSMVFIMGWLRGGDAKGKNEDMFHARQCSSEAPDGEVHSGLFACWGAHPNVIAAMLISQTQGWLGGIVSKQLSSVVKAVAQCLSLLVVYSVGDLLLKGESFDWPVGSMALQVCLAVLAFTWAGQGAQRKIEEVLAADVEGDEALNSSTTHTRMDPSQAGEDSELAHGLAMNRDFSHSSRFQLVTSERELAEAREHLGHSRVDLRGLSWNSGD